MSGSHTTNYYNIIMDILYELKIENTQLLCFLTISNKSNIYILVIDLCTILYNKKMDNGLSFVENQLITTRQ